MARKKPEPSPPPASTDFAGWCAAIEAGHLTSFRTEDIIAALEDLGPDIKTQIRNKLAKEISDRFTRILRSNVGFNHPNQGQDIIDRTNFKLFKAISTKNSNDGHTLRNSCYSLVLLRMKDAIREESRERRTAEEFIKTDKPADAAEMTSASSEVAEPEIDFTAESERINGDSADVTWALPPSEASEPDEDEDAPPSKATYDPSHFEGVNEMHEDIDVNRLLEHEIPNPRKRLAFYLHIQRAPQKNIAKALGKDVKTIRLWIKEIQELLKTKVRKS